MSRVEHALHGSFDNYNNIDIERAKSGVTYQIQHGSNEVSIGNGARLAGFQQEAQSKHSVVDGRTGHHFPFTWDHHKHFAAVSIHFQRIAPARVCLPQRDQRQFQPFRRFFWKIPLPLPPPPKKKHQELVRIRERERERERKFREKGPVIKSFNWFQNDSSLRYWQDIIRVDPSNKTSIPENSIGQTVAIIDFLQSHSVKVPKDLSL